MEHTNLQQRKFGLRLAAVCCVFLVTLATLAVLPSPSLSQPTFDAQACQTPCVTPGTYEGAIGVLGANTVTGITTLTTEVSATITGAFAAMLTAITLQINETIWSFYVFFHNLWYGDVLPALQDMDKQALVMEMEQARVTASLMDAQGQAELLMDMEHEEVKSERELRPGAGTAVASTMVGGLNRAASFKNSYRNASTKETAPRSAGATGSLASAGTRADVADRWNRYQANYCRKDYNNGAAGCSDDKLLADMDVNVTKTIFGKETIDMTDANLRAAVDDLITNIAEPFALPPTANTAVNTAEGQANILEKESYKAKRQTIYDALYHIVGRRAPGSNMGEYVAALRSNSGIPSAAIAANPSYNEVMHAMLNERFRSGQYSLEQVDEPENNKREMVIQQAFMVMQLNDQLELLDRQALILAAQVGDSIRRSKQTGSAAGGATIK